MSDAEILIVKIYNDVLRQPLFDATDAHGLNVVTTALARIDRGIHWDDTRNTIVQDRKDQILNKCSTSLVDVSFDTHTIIETAANRAQVDIVLVYPGVSKV